MDSINSCPSICIVEKTIETHVLNVQLLIDLERVTDFNFIMINLLNEFH